MIEDTLLKVFSFIYSIWRYGLWGSINTSAAGLLSNRARTWEEASVSSRRYHYSKEHMLLLAPGLGVNRWEAE